MKTTYIAPGGDLKDAKIVRDDVFVKEQGFSMEEEYDEMDSLSHHVVIFKNEKPVATSRFFRNPKDTDQYRFGRIAVLKQYRGTGIGEMLLVAMEKKAVELGGKKVWLDAQVRVTGFYEKMGFQITGIEHMDGHVPHIEMEKIL